MRTSSRAPTSAFLPTPVQHVCRPPSTPVLNRFFLFYISLFSSPLFYLYLGYPSRHPPQPDRSPSSHPRSSQELPGVVGGGQRVSKSLPVPLRWPTDPARPLPFLTRPALFAPRLSAFGDRRLHGRLDGQSPAVGLQKRHQPRTFPNPCRHQSVSSLGGRVRTVVREPGVN